MGLKNKTKQASTTPNQQKPKSANHNNEIEEKNDHQNT
jgi:hypothetical protein